MYAKYTTAVPLKLWLPIVQVNGNKQYVNVHMQYASMQYVNAICWHECKHTICRMQYVNVNMQYANMQYVSIKHVNVNMQYAGMQYVNVNIQYAACSMSM